MLYNQNDHDHSIHAGQSGRALLKLVGEFAEGLECEFDVRTTPHADVRARLPGR
jgi:hypothetical protein